MSAFKELKACSVKENMKAYTTGEDQPKMAIKRTKKGFEECLVKSFQSKKFENISEEEAKKGFRGTV